MTRRIDAYMTAFDGLSRAPVMRQAGVTVLLHPVNPVPSDALPVVALFCRSESKIPRSNGGGVPSFDVSALLHVQTIAAREARELALAECEALHAAALVAILCDPALQKLVRLDRAEIKTTVTAQAGSELIFEAWSEIQLGPWAEDFEPAPVTFETGTGRLPTVDFGGADTSIRIPGGTASLDGPINPS